ncbi:MAG: tRNA-dihydrouridine synthase family protein [Planctomycetota bacterium]|nr:tRNA-dihydrouridine synthase family protein [Planctomycetota bacterium]
MLAPIAGWCDLAWRMTCRELGGVGLACTDLLSPKGLLCGSEASQDLARTNEFDRPIGMQLYGSDPALLAEGARWCVDHGATVVDINMGCPVDKVCKKDGGSRLMCIPDTATAIVAAVRAAMPDRVPLTAKMRLGWTDADAEQNAAGQLACRLIDEGAALITVHGRTTEQRFKGQCRREGIRRVVEMVAAKTGRYTGEPGGGVPVVGNGDIRTPGDVVSMLDETGCAGVMIGRGAFAMPWIFRLAWAAQFDEQAGSHPTPPSPGLQSGDGRGGTETQQTHLNATRTEVRGSEVSGVVGAEPSPGLSGEPTEPEKIEIVRRYYDRMCEHRNETAALHRLRNKISWLGKGINGSHCRPLKEAIRTATTRREVHAALDAWLARPDAAAGIGSGTAFGTTQALAD